MTKYRSEIFKAFALAAFIGLTGCLPSGQDAQAPIDDQALATISEDIRNSIENHPDAAFQIVKGKRIFGAECASCHLPGIFTSQMQANWQGKTFKALLDKTKDTMPPESAGTLNEQDHLDVLAYILAYDQRQNFANMKVEETDWHDHIILPPQRIITDASLEGAVDWPYFRGDSGASAYAALPGLTLEKFHSLKPAWTMNLAAFGPVPEQKNPVTPLVVDGVMYLTAGLSRNVIALDAKSGQMLWMYRPQEGNRLDNAPRKGAGRGVGYWEDPQGRGRIILITPGFYLTALDALTGQPVTGFGASGHVDMMNGLRLPPDGSRDIGNSSPPMIVGDVIVVGPAHATSMAPSRLHNVKGDIRGFDARSGKLLWTFHTIPEPDEPGYESWENNSALTTGNAGVWAPMSADPELGIVYLPVEASTHDIYGGHRHGSNLYANSLVALDALTGKRLWHHQLVHHDLWDWDLPCAPMLVDIPGGKKVVVQLTKQGFAFVFDRKTGKPLWPIEERPVPASDVPGEKAYPTQPFPTKPPAFERQGFSDEVIVDFTPEIRERAEDLIKDLRMGTFFSPPSLLEAPDGTGGTLSLPGAFGGVNWEGGAVDTETGVIFVPSITHPATFNLGTTDNPDVPYVSGKRYRLSVDGIPIIKPPYGRITAIDLKTGDIKWQVANADGPDAVVNHPLLSGIDLPRLGKPNRSGLLATKHLLIAGEGYDGAPILRAFDKNTGEELAALTLPGTQTGLPMAFTLGGNDYLAMTVSGENKAARLVVYTY